MTHGIDKDLVAAPAARTTSAGYIRCLDAHVAQSARHFSEALPARGLFSMFKSKIDRQRLSGAFEEAYRKLAIDISIALTPGEDMSGVTGNFRPVLLFVTDERTLIAPENFSSAESRSGLAATQGDAETVAMGFVYQLIGTMARVLKESGLDLKQQKKGCAAAAFGIAMDFDDLPLAEPVDGHAVAPVLGYADTAGKLVLLPSAAAQHEIVHSLADQYFAELETAPQ